jgi:CRP-like cAMP-binding protein
MPKRNQIKILTLEEVFPAWKGLTPDERQYVKSNFTVQTFEKNQKIHSEGDVPSHMMLLASGKLKVFKQGSGKRPQIVRLLKPGSTFGYRAIIAKANYNTNVVAMEVSIVYMLKADIFINILQHNNAFCFFYLTDMAEDLGNSDRLAVNLTQKHIRGRLAETLLTLKEIYGTEPDSATINIKLTREELASMSNMTTSNAIRTLSLFFSEKLVDIWGKNIKILDEDELRKISKSG